MSRRTLLAASGLLAVGGLSGCLNSVASAVTNTVASPAAVFAREGAQMSLSDPRVSRLTPTLSAGSRGFSGEVEMEGWVTSSSVVAANYNNTRSNRSSIASPDSAVTDEELEQIHKYLEGEAVVAERFTVCLPDAEVPGGNGSIKQAVTPKRFIDYMAGRGGGSGRVYSWGDTDSDGDGLGDCDDSREGSGEPERVCGHTEHLLAVISGPLSTGGSLEVLRVDDGSVVIINSPPEADSRHPIALVTAGGGSDGPESSTEAIYQGRLEDADWSAVSDGGERASLFIFDTLVSQVMVQPPECPHPFPALLYMGRAESDGQLIYAGGWVIDDAALYENSVTMLTMETATPVVGVDVGDTDSDGDGLSDAVEKSVSSGGSRLIQRRRRGARLDAGVIDALAEEGVLSAGGKKGYDHYVRKKPGVRTSDDSDAAATHLALDAPIFHLINAGEASNEVKFKAGAELSKSVN